MLSIMDPVPGMSRSAQPSQSESLQSTHLSAGRLPYSLDFIKGYGGLVSSRSTDSRSITVSAFSALAQRNAPVSDSAKVSTVPR